MNFHCKTCNYSTKIKCNFEKHNKTDKHISNLKHNRFCKLCNKEYSTAGNYKRHLDKVHLNNQNVIDNSNHDYNLDDIIKPNKTNQIHDISDNHLNHLNQLNQFNNNSLKEIKEIKDIVTSSNKIVVNKIDDLNKSNHEVVSVVNKAITKASSLIKYLMEHHKSTPPLKKINYNECINLLKIDYQCPNDDFLLQEKLIREHKNNLFVKRLSQCILKLIHHKNQNKQSIWNTDCARNHYVVKTPLSWNEDKAGLKFTEYVIRPMLNHIRELITKYRIESLEILMKTKTISDYDKQKYNELLSDVLNFECALMNETYIPQFLKELSPHLRYLHEELEELEKFEELEELQENLKNIIKKRVNSDSDSETKSDSEIDLDDDNIIINSDDDDIYIPQKIYKKRII